MKINVGDKVKWAGFTGIIVAVGSINSSGVLNEGLALMQFDNLHIGHPCLGTKWKYGSRPDGMRNGYFLDIRLRPNGTFVDPDLKVLKEVEYIENDE